MIYFLDEKEIKEATPVQNNVDMLNVDQNIEPIFDLIIKEDLGSYFTIDLLDRYQVYKVNNDPNIFNTYEKELIKLIKKTMKWAFAYNCYFDLSWQLSNKGTVAGSSDYYQPVQDPTIKFKADRTNERSNGYRVRMNKYICDNISEFPKFTNVLNNDRGTRCDCECSTEGSIYVTII